MNTPPRSALKSLTATTTGPHSAEPAPAASGSGAPKVVARQGVPVAVLPDPHAVTVAGIRPGLTVRGLGRNQIPTADWLCACGHHERARGRDRVTALTTRARVDHCPHTEQHRRNAA
ncbi:hypothetical protein ACTFBT_20770 [Streptomyces microflavus]|uniref:Uncharacterized protein n=1 Tax=Streptomyces microflavus TaxID=1919 RepID=A0A7J0CV27_STRMI|nr:MULTISPECIES: hypothetical protein [Streptomyces]MDX2979295.1 hypothetical protein [Streptomyces sp. NRRL_B-2249]GFN05607.1 hypothetical protein Smic_41630 [Streptomyces microflavus]GGX53789.1 hypothetical protein GCM10010298_17320 [Streptomyces microflavus]